MGLQVPAPSALRFTDAEFGEWLQWAVSGSFSGEMVCWESIDHALPGLGSRIILWMDGSFLHL